MTDARYIPENSLTSGDDVGEYCLVGQDTITTWHSSQVANNKLHKDPAQEAIVAKLQDLSNQLVKARDPDPKQGLFGNWFSNDSSPQPRSLYIHGTVGRGKSFLMDGFFLNLPRADKMRVHFHAFMRHFHADMKRLEGKKDALVEVANELANKSSLLCFDEFHVSDITDAMVLGRMLEVFMERGVVIVATSNYAPKNLYPNGLARDRFLPTIALIEERFDICSLDGDTDYRLRALSKAGLYLNPINEETTQGMTAMFDDLALGMSLRSSVKVGNRRMPALARTSDAVWLDFAEICEGNYGQNDYLQLAERFTSVFLSGVPQLETESNAEATRRFTWLIDVLYDARVKLVIQADQPMSNLFAGGGGESGRTLSRLQEMQSKEYLKEEVRPPQIL